jgi:hypothetical protein
MKWCLKTICQQQPTFAVLVSTRRQVMFKKIKGEFMKKLLQSLLGILFLVSTGMAMADVIVVAPVHHYHHHHYHHPHHAAVVLRLGDPGYHGDDHHDDHH